MSVSTDAGIVAHLNAMPRCRAVKMRGSAYLVNEADVLGCLAGRMLAIEVKRLGERARPGQLAVLRKWRACGAVTGVARCAADVDLILEAHGWDGSGWRS